MRIRAPRSLVADARMTSRLFKTSEKEMSGLASASCRTISSIWPSSVSGPLRNFRRAGRLPKRWATLMFVPGAQPQSCTSRMAPLSTTISVPTSSSFRRVCRMNRETEEMDGIASPLNPNDLICPTSASVEILLVAWASKHMMASSRSMPQPLSVTCMSRWPPCSAATRIRVAPASMEFSTSSLTTDAGRSTTSPAAIRPATSADNTRMMLI